MHKGKRSEAEMAFMFWSYDPTWNPKSVHPELFNELNLSSEELRQLAAWATDKDGAEIIANHPNADAGVKAALFKFLLTDED